MLEGKEVRSDGNRRLTIAELTAFLRRTRVLKLHPEGTGETSKDSLQDSVNSSTDSAQLTVVKVDRLNHLSLRTLDRCSCSGWVWLARLAKKVDGKHTLKKT